MYLKHALGKHGEDLACNYLEKHNYKIIERNFRCKKGEIDIIAKDINGMYHIWEFASPSQAGGTGLKMLVNKISIMSNNNPGMAWHFVPW